jgi:hypothetical protein
MMRLPMSLEEVTPAWMQEALSERWPGVRVSSVRHDRISHGAATRARLSLTYDAFGGGAPPPATLWLKTGFEAHHDFAMPNYATEVDFYRTIRRVLPIRSPESYFALTQEHPAQATILMEDLTTRGVVFNLATKPLSVNQAASGLEQLALLHSQPLSTPELEHLHNIGAVEHATDDRGRRSERFFKWLRAWAAPAVLHRPDRIRAGYDKYWTMIYAAPHSLLHGDSHVGNSYTEPGDQVSFLDWQGYGTGYWMQDVPYFLIGALDLPDRRSAERDLLGYYLSRRDFHGRKVPSVGDVWDDYRRAVIFGFITWLGNEDFWQLPETNMAQFARFSAAMIDHDVFNALGV